MENDEDIELENPFGKTFSRQAETEYYNKNYDECIRYADLAIDNVPTIYEGYLYKGKGLYKKRKYIEAEIPLLKCLELDKKRAEVYPILVYNKNNLIDRNIC